MKYKNFTGPNVALTGGFVGGTPIANFPPFQPGSYIYGGSMGTTGESNPLGIWFKPDGTKIFYTGPVSDRVYQRTLSTPWDILSAGTATNSGLLSTTSPSSVVWDDINGDKILVSDSVANTVVKYSVGTPWDATTINNSTPVQTNSTIFGTFRANPQALWANPAGTILLGANTSPSATLGFWTGSTGWDLTTFGSSSSTGIASVNGVSVLSDGNILSFTTTSTMTMAFPNAPYTTGWSTTTSFTNLISSIMGSNICDLYWKSDGSAFYLASITGAVHQWFKR